MGLRDASSGRAAAADLGLRACGHRRGNGEGKEDGVEVEPGGHEERGCRSANAGNHFSKSRESTRAAARTLTRATRALHRARFDSGGGGGDAARARRESGEL